MRYSKVFKRAKSDKIGYGNVSPETWNLAHDFLGWCDAKLKMVGMHGDLLQPQIEPRYATLRINWALIDLGYLEVIVDTEKVNSLRIRSEIHETSVNISMSDVRHYSDISSVIVLLIQLQIGFYLDRLMELDTSPYRF